MSEEQRHDVSISPRAYKKIVQNLQLEGVALEKVDAEFRPEYQGQQLTLSTRRTRKQWEDRANELGIRLWYRLTAYADNSDKPALVLKATYKCTYDYSGEDKISDAFIEPFVEYVVSFTVWPYLRELVASTVTRMNLPPLALPMIKKV